MSSLPNGEEDWRKQHTARLELAKKYPAMFIGEPATAHRHAITETLRLVWDAYAFRRPTSAFILLSPTQYLIRCYTGPLVRPIQQMFPWGDTPVLDGGWHKPHNHIIDERSYRLFYDLPRLRGWRDRFGSSTGPTLYSPLHPLVLAQRFAIGYRVDRGMWCQTFQNGWPVSTPSRLLVPSSVGLLAAAELDPQWFTGLPFGEKEVAILAGMPHVTVAWHGKDDLLPVGSLLMEIVQDWIQS